MNAETEGRKKKTAVDILLLLCQIAVLLCVIILAASTLLYAVVFSAEDRIVFTHTRWLPLGLGVLSLFLVTFVLKKVHFKINKIVFAVLLGLYTVINILIVCKLSLYPANDQFYMTYIATDMLQGEYKEFGYQGYMCLFPFQFGFVRYVWLIFKIFGQDNYIALQIINALFLSGIIFFFVKSTKYLFGEIKYIVGIALMCFAPLTLYTTFIYGTIPSLFFSTVAIFFLLRLINNEKPVVLNIVIIVAADLLSVVLKTNAIIILIAQSMVLILFAIKEKSRKGIIITIVSVVAIWGFNTMTTELVNRDLYRYTYSDKIGTPKITWIVMGLSDDSTVAEGWHNYYNRDVYWDNDCDQEVATELSKEAIAGSLKRFADHPGYAARFFWRKITSSWTNPSFEAIRNVDTSRKLNENKEKDYDELTLRFFEKNEGCSLDESSPGINGYLKIYEVAVIIGLLYYVIRKKITIYDSIYLIIFVGGFLFNLFWEAGCRYMLPYFAVIIPYGCVGFEQIADRIILFLSGKKQAGKKRFGGIDEKD